MSDAGQRDVEWRIDELPRVQGDNVLLRQAFMNLLNNAVKFTRHRERAVIEIRAQLKAGREVEISVRDNGAGFDMRYADNLYGVFQRLHHESEFEGTGIGLAIVRRIIERHGGKTWAESELGKGATFYLTLTIT
jgi:light-regulated signal transduction histidine kinase (bacteriophytochrome)